MNWIPEREVLYRMVNSVTWIDETVLAASPH